MEDTELGKLLVDLESDRVERKASIAQIDRICEAICAFANDLPDHRKPGVIFVGATDDGSCADLPITDPLLVRLADLRSNGNIHPFPSMVVQKKTLNDCDIAVIIVYPSDLPPVRYKGLTCIRIGPRRAIATIEEEQRLIEKRRYGVSIPYDMHPVDGSSIEDLDLELFEKEYLPSAIPSDIIEQNTRSIPEQLISLRFLTSEGLATVSGILVLGKHPREFMPGAYVQFLRIEGTVITDPIKDQKELHGPIAHLLRELEEVLKINVSVSSNVRVGDLEERRPDYPIVALQQLIRNAVMHRTYESTYSPVRVFWFSDRIEIHSPGGPFGSVNRGNFAQPGIVDYRNPNIAEAMKNLGYVQRFGSGIPLAIGKLQNNGNPMPDFIVEDTNILVVVKKII
ncbi:MAG: transcriptional regulator [Planctomycetes bacterium]|nr:transcriptional regulator [Planctomycetota bacterium]